MGGVIFTLMAFMAAGIFTSCNKTETEDDQPTEKTKLATPVIAQDVTATETSLSFSWETVENAAGYKYELFNADSDDNALAANGTTEETSVTISDLLSGTSYTFKLTATAASDSDFADSDAVTATAKTTGKTPLKTPVVTVEATDNSLTFSWEADDNANGYAYELLDEDGEKVEGQSTNNTSVTIENLELFTTYTFNLTATAAADSELYKDSEPATVKGTTGTIEALLGEYIEETKAWDFVHAEDYYNGEKYESNGNIVTIEKDSESETGIIIRNFYKIDTPLKGIVDLENKTIIIEDSDVEAGDYDYYFTYLYEEYLTTDDECVVATFDKNCVINVENWSLFDNEWYNYVEGLYYYSGDGELEWDEEEEEWVYKQIVPIEESEYSDVPLTTLTKKN